MYTSQDGFLNDHHLVHLGNLARGTHTEAHIDTEHRVTKYTLGQHPTDTRR